jgi:hypothetical protein
MTSFGTDANRWAISGLRIMLGGQAKDPAVARMLGRLREPRQHNRERAVGAASAATRTA